MSRSRKCRAAASSSSVALVPGTVLACQRPENLERLVRERAWLRLCGETWSRDGGRTRFGRRCWRRASRRNGRLRRLRCWRRLRFGRRCWRRCGRRNGRLCGRRDLRRTWRWLRRRRGCAVSAGEQNNRRAYEDGHQKPGRLTVPCLDCRLYCRCVLAYRPQVLQRRGT